MRVISAGHVPLAPEYDGRRLLLRDRPALLRMAHLARYICRNLVRQRESGGTEPWETRVC